MNEEEKEAIECLELVIDNESDIETEDLTNKCIKNILNLIKKQQKKIEKLEDRNKTLEIEFEIKKYCKVNELASDLIFYKNLARNYQGNCISKDKIKEIIYPTPENPISIEIQSSVMYKKIDELLGE